MTHRIHCLVWSDYSTQALLEKARGIRLDTNYYFYPGSWIADRPGFFTGSGMPMRFVDSAATILDIYQATTQMTDESNQTYPMTVNSLLDKAIGAEGYYGAFTANMHTDYNPSAGSVGSDAIVASAQARGVPVIAARQLLTWLDGRNGSSFQGLSWNGSTLSFSVAIGTGANGLQTMLPASVAAGTLTSLTLNGVPVAFTTDHPGFVRPSGRRRHISGDLYAVDFGEKQSRVTCCWCGQIGRVVVAVGVVAIVV